MRQCSLQPVTLTSEVWDPGGLRERLKPTIAAIAAAMDREAGYNGIDMESRTDLDSHANMPVVGKHGFIISETGKKVDVSPFSPDYKPLVAMIVDAAIQYDDPFDGQSYILVIRNALQVPSMLNNLLPPFMMREAGIKVNDVPKIHVDNPTGDDHAIIFQETGFKIPLALWGTFSYFPSTKPTHQMLSSPPDIYILTPSNWNPHSDAYAQNEESMLDWSGQMKEMKDRSRVVIVDELPEDQAMISALIISEKEQVYVDKVFSDVNDDETSKDLTLYDKLKDQVDISSFKMTIGSTFANDSPYIVSDNESESIDDSEPDFDLDTLQDADEENQDAFLRPQRLLQTQGVTIPLIWPRYGESAMMKLKGQLR